MNALRMIVWIGCVIGLLRMQYLPATVICDYGNVQKMHYAFVSILYRDRAGTSVSDEADRWLRKQYIKFIKNPIKEFKGKAAD